MQNQVNREREPGHIWMVRTRGGAVRKVHSLTHMAMLLLDGKLDGRDEISLGDERWTPLEHVIDTYDLAATLRALGHLRHEHLAA